MTSPLAVKAQTWQISSEMGGVGMAGEAERGPDPQSRDSHIGPARGF